jgi:protein-S-isoprenylcysteine O-methyltransferase Ste14
LPSRYRVPLGYVVGALVLVLSHPGLRSLALAGPLLLGGELVRLWASGHIEKTRRLATGGPYAHSRNPLYFGSLLMALGAAVASDSIWAVLAVALYFAAFYPAVIREESAFLARKFPEEYAAWSKAVPAFLPRLRPGGPRSSRFAWARIASNREWRTLAAVPLLLGLLYVRGRFLP